jgi:hypothetical protein
MHFIGFYTFSGSFEPFIVGYDRVVVFVALCRKQVHGIACDELGNASIDEVRKEFSKREEK